MKENTAPPESKTEKQSTDETDLSAASCSLSVAALFVQERGCYSDLPFVDAWPESRDARKYKGPMPVVAHPPCSRWCRLAGLVQARWGHKIGDDGGCFESALNSVRRWGGLLEHPAYSKAFAAYGLAAPNRHGGWQRSICGGWVCHVEQCAYGHAAKKATWLYSYGVAELPSLKWGSSLDQKSDALVSWCGNKVSSNETRPRLSSREASATPKEFRDALLEIAISANA